MAERADQATGAESRLITRVRGVYEAKREAHPELRRPLTWNGARAILRREGIPLLAVPLTRDAALISGRGILVMLINADVPPRRHTYFVAHELAHAWLHADEGDEPCFHMDHDWHDDPREDEAEALAALMLGGPRFVRYF